MRKIPSELRLLISRPWLIFNSHPEVDSANEDVQTPLCDKDLGSDFGMITLVDSNVHAERIEKETKKLAALPVILAGIEKPRENC
jgi:hypothetical protein